MTLLITVKPVYNNHFWDHYNMVVIDRWSLYRNTVSNNHLIKWSLCAGFSKTVNLSNLTWKLPWVKPTFYKVHRSCKQLNEVNRSGKALHKVDKICKQCYEVHRIYHQLYEVCKICKQLYKVQRTRKQLLSSCRSCEQLHKVCGTCQ